MLWDKSRTANRSARLTERINIPESILHAGYALYLIYWIPKNTYEFEEELAIYMFYGIESKACRASEEYFMGRGWKRHVRDETTLTKLMSQSGYSCQTHR